MPKGVIFDEKQTLTSLFESAKSLKIIPENFPFDFFENYFFYFFIERDFFQMREEEKFAKYGFGQDYYKAMLQAFDFVFKNAQVKKIDDATIDEIYLLTTEGPIPDEKRKKRGVLKIENALFEMQSRFSSGYYYYQASKKYLENVLINPIAKSYLIPRLAFGGHINHIGRKKDELQNKLLTRLHLYDKSKFEIEKTVKILLFEYHRKMTIIDEDEKLKQDQKEEEKIKLIAIFINDIQRFHPYCDGNGRTFCFLILNYLLISQNLSPAFIFNSWYLSYSMPDELLILVKEGQLAYQKFFLGNEKIKEEDRKKPLLEELSSLYIPEKNLTNINQFIFLAIATGMQIQAIQGDKRYSDLQAKLQERFDGAVKRLYGDDYHDNLREIENLQFPINGKTFFDNIAIRGIQFLLMNEEDYLLLRQSFSQEDCDQELKLLAKNLFPGKSFGKIFALVQELDTMKNDAGARFKILFNSFYNEFMPKMIYGDFDEILQKIIKEVRPEKACTAVVEAANCEKVVAAIADLDCSKFS